MLFGVILFLAHFSARAGDGLANPPADDYTIHALYIYNFTKYIQWPIAAKKIKIGVAGNAAMEEFLAKMAKVKSNSDLEINVVNTTNEGELGTCQIVLIPSSTNSGATSKLIESFNSRPVLVITEQENLTKKGASISFKIIDGKLRFQINEEVIKTKGLKMASALSSMAEK